MSNGRPSKFSAEIVQKATEMAQAGATAPEIAKETGMPVSAAAYYRGLARKTSKVLQPGSEESKLLAKYEGKVQQLSALLAQVQGDLDRATLMRDNLRNVLESTAFSGYESI